MKDWRSVFSLPKTFEDDVEGEVLASAILHSPSLTVLSFLVTPLNVIALVLVLMGNQEAPLALALAGGLSAIQIGLLWNYGVKVWAIRESLICIVMLTCAVVSRLNV